eukprot:TCONS_00017371-protein
MSFDVLPNEILKLIVSFLSKEDAKKVSLTSKKMYDLTLDRIWYKIKPKYHLFGDKIGISEEIRTVGFFKKLSHLPIREISIYYFPKWSCKKVHKAFPLLKLLHFDRLESSTVLGFNTKYFSQFKMPMVIYTHMLEVSNQSHFDELLQVMKTCNVVKFVINHFCEYRDTYQIRWSPVQLETIINAVPKITISLDCLALTRKNAKQFYKSISRNKNCKVYKRTAKHYRYLFSARDIGLMARYDIKITKLYSGYLKIPSVENDQSLQKFAEALTKLSHLKSFEFHYEHLPTTIDYFTNVPITSLSTHAFEISGKDKIEKVVQTLSKMKSLRRFSIGSSDYKFLPEDLAMFKGLPVKYIYLAALDLTKKNIPDFGRIIME